MMNDSFFKLSGHSKWQIIFPQLAKTVEILVTIRPRHFDARNHAHARVAHTENTHTGHTHTRARAHTHALHTTHRQGPAVR